MPYRLKESRCKNKRKCERKGSAVMMERKRERAGEISLILEIPHIIIFLISTMVLRIQSVSMYVCVSISSFVYRMNGEIHSSCWLIIKILCEGLLIHACLRIHVYYTSRTKQTQTYQITTIIHWKTFFGTWIQIINNKFSSWRTGIRFLLLYFSHSVALVSMSLKPFCFGLLQLRELWHKYFDVTFSTKMDQK